MDYHDILKSPLVAEANDPTVECLTVDKENWDKRAGQAIGDSKTLRELRITIVPELEPDPWLGELLQHLPRNRSIKQLDIVLFELKPNQCKYILKMDIFRSLVLFIEHNSNLIDIDFFVLKGTASILHSLSLALSSCKSKRLEKISLHCGRNNPGDGDICTSLNGYNNLREICVRSIKIETEGVTVLSNLLKKPTSSICSLELENNSLDDEHITILVNGFIGNKDVTSISFRENPNITAVGWGRFSQALFHPECAIKILRLADANLDDEGFTVLGYALNINKSIKSLDLAENNTITLEGLRGLLQCMRNPDTSLDDLELSYCRINDEGVGLIMEKVAQSVSLKTLSMSSNESITSRGLKTIYHAMFNCELSLEVIVLERNEGIDFDDFEEEDLLVFPRAICDKSSINNTFYSNHTIQSIELDEYDPYENRDYDDPVIDRMFEIDDDRRELLDMNCNKNKVEVARKKIMRSHFSGEAVDISVFALMPETLLPHAIEWIGRDREDRFGFSLMYQFVAGNPLYFSDDNYSSRAAKKLKQSS